MKPNSRPANDAKQETYSHVVLFVENPLPMFVFDPDSLRILEANRAAVNHYGFTHDELVGMRMSRIRVGTDEELLWRSRNLPKGAPEWFASTHRRCDGSLINVEVAVAETRWKGAGARFSIIRDVTEQLKTQANLARTLRFARIGIWELDIATQEVSWTDEVFRIFGYDSPSVPMTFASFVEHIHPEDRERFDAAFAASLLSGEPYEIVHRILRPDGTERIVHESAVIERDDALKPNRAMGTVMDVTDRVTLEQDLRLRSEALAMAQRIAKLGTWDHDIISGHFEWSRELYEIYGMNPAVDTPSAGELWEHDHADDAERVRGTISRARESHTPYDLDHRIVRSDGEVRWVHEQGAYTYDAAGAPMRFIGTVLDITERKRAEENIAFQATHDQLTGLPNYTLLLDRLRQAIIKAQRDERVVAVAFLDVDRFKSVNDALGHAAGDDVLKQVARRLQERVSEGDTVSRMGGDEFILVLSNIAPPTDIGDRAQNVLGAFNSPFQVGGREFFFTASIGISVYPNDHGDAAQLIHDADLAMYVGKGKARNTLQFFSAELHERALRRLSIENGLRGAIERDELTIVYQPIVAATSTMLISVEALLRWRPQGKPVVGPAEFIPVAEDTGLIVAIGEWVLKQACKQWRSWCDRGLRPIRISVNISGKQLERPDFVSTVKTALIEAQMPAQYLDLEITETILMTQTVLPSLEALRALGIRLIIDDFGTGYSSLAYLKHMPIDSLKIDRSFVSYAESSPADVPISNAIIGIARSLGLRVVAEGIETEAQASILRDLGCDYLQGYYFARPGPEEVIAKMLKKAL